jgi:hypothetical protein
VEHTEPERAASTGRTAAQLAGDLGADGLHDLEARHLLDALAVRPAAVVAARVGMIGRTR